MADLADLKAILSRVPAARDMELRALDRDERGPAERQRRQVERRQVLQILCGLGT